MNFDDLKNIWVKEKWKSYTQQCYVAERFLACSLGIFFFPCLNQNLYTQTLRPAVIPAVTSKRTAGMKGLPGQIHRLGLWVQLSQQMKTEGKLTMNIFRKKNHNQTPKLCRQQGALHPMCLLFFSWGLMSQCVKSCIPWAEACWSRWLGEGGKGHVVTIAPLHQNSCFQGEVSSASWGSVTPGLEEWLEGNSRDFTQTSWHMGVLGYITLRDGSTRSGCVPDTLLAPIS